MNLKIGEWYNFPVQNYSVFAFAAIEFCMNAPTSGRFHFFARIL